MLFNSFTFLAFFPAVSGLYFLLPHRFRWILLLVASCGFYMFFKPIYILILAFTIVTDYFSGIYIEKFRMRPGIKRSLLVASLTANIGVLAMFKYYNFINANITRMAHFAGWENSLPFLAILLPIGLSFHTFQAMSYTIEVYRGRQNAERHFGLYALYVMFYPQLVAGPIERPQNLLPQFSQPHRFNYRRTVSGLRLMLWGFFKKMVVADNLGVVVDNVYRRPFDQNGLTCVLAMYFFAFQIYCDFSGYTDIARGAARVIGFQLMENFNLPYIAKSVGEFWKRWHISLSTWFRDYLYIPLGGNRIGICSQCFNLGVVFLLSGLWHGARWTYVFWGLLNGVYVIIGVLSATHVRKYLSPAIRAGIIWRIAAWFATFHLTCLTWVLFRAASLSAAIGQLRKIVTAVPELFSGMAAKRTTYEGLQLAGIRVLPWLIALIAVFFIIDVAKEHHAVRARFERSGTLRHLSYGAMLFSICIFGYAKEVRFIYFQF